MIFGKIRIEMKIINSIIKIYFISLVLFLVSCEPTETPVDTSGEITFFMDGTLDGQPFNISAGQEETYLYTDYQIDNEDVYHFEGVFAKIPNCLDNCSEALKISLPCDPHWHMINTQQREEKVQ